MKLNTFILKCFLQFTCTNLDGSQKKGSKFLNLLQKQGVPRKGGFPQKRGDFNPGGNYDIFAYHPCYVTSLSTADLTLNFSESNYIYPSYKWFKLCSDSTNT